MNRTLLILLALTMTALADGLSGAVCAHAAISDGMVAWYPFNGNANDASGNGFHGTSFGPVLAGDRLGSANSAYLFDGIDDYISTNPFSKVEHGEFTISLWAKGTGTFISQKTPAYGSMRDYESYFSYSLSRNILGYHFGLYQQPSWAGSFQLSTSRLGDLSTDFHHFVARGVQTGSESHKVELFVDGALLGVGNTGYGIPAWQYIEFGRNVIEKNGQFSGVMDDVKVWDRALSDDEIRALHSETATIRYAALGDSFSCGQGTYSYMTECLRSKFAYPWLLDGIAPLNAEAFVACSGAQTSNVRTCEAPEDGQCGVGWHGEDPQIKQITDIKQKTGKPWDIVTVTIGGNDIGFVEIAEVCAVLPACHSWGGLWWTYGQVVSNKIRSLGPKLKATYEEIVASSGDGAPPEVYVLGYPYLLSTRPDVPPSDPVCPLTMTAFDVTERLWFHDLVDQLNCAIEAAASQVEHVHYVPVTSYFSGREACSMWYPWLTNPLETWKPHWLHPTPSGHKAYARILSDFLANHPAATAPSCPSASQSAGSLANVPTAASDEPLPSFGDLHVEATESKCDSRGVYVPGQVLRVRGEVFSADTAVTVSLTADQGNYTAELAVLTAGQDGRLDGTVNLPPGAPVEGLALVEARGLGSDGGQRFLVELTQLAPSSSADGDGDSVPDTCDNCPGVANGDQLERDEDGIGDACDACPDDPANDADHDGLCAGADPCPLDAANDADHDGVCESLDTCPLAYNPDQADSDGDGRGDACEDKPCYSISLGVNPLGSGGLNIGIPPNCRGNQYEQGTEIEIAAVSREGFVFTGWTGGVEGASNPVKVTITSDLSVQATFREECLGDCDGEGSVGINELLTSLNIALGLAPVSRCAVCDDDHNGRLTVDELVAAVRNALNGCPIPATTPPPLPASPSPTPSVSPPPTDTPP